MTNEIMMKILINIQCENMKKMKKWRKYCRNIMKMIMIMKEKEKR